MCIEEDKDVGFSQPPSPNTDHDAIENRPESPNSPLHNDPATDVPPDGGYGWVCTVACAVINGHTWGMNSAYGVFLAHYLDTDTFPGATRLQYALIGGLSISMALFISPIATVSTRVLGTRATLFIGIALETGSFIGASFASKIWHLFLAQGVCFGWGMGFLFTGSVGITAQWFLKRRSLANGIAAAGSGFGGLTYSLAANAAISHVGLAWAFRILGIAAFVANTISAILLRDRNKAVGARHLAFDFKLLKRPEFLVLLSFGTLSMLAYVVLLFSVPNFASSISLTAQQGSIVGAILNLGQGLGRVPIGYFSDTIGRINMAAIMTLVASVLALVIWTNSHVYGLLIFYVLVGGTVAGTYWAVVAPVTAEVVGLRDLPSALSITWISLTISTLFSEPIGLQIVAINNGNYLGAQLYVGFMYLGAALCMLLLRAWKIGQIEATALSLHVSPESLTPERTADIEAKDHIVAISPYAKRLVRWQKV